MKRFLVILVICLFCFSCLWITGCTEGQQQDTALPEAETEYLSFEAALERATDVIDAVYISTDEAEHYVEHRFQVRSVLKGETTEEIICVFDQPQVIHVENTDISYLSQQTMYEEGERYLLVLERYRSVYYEHDRYSVLADLFIPLSAPEQATMYDEEITEHMEVSSGGNAPTDINAVLSDEAWRVTSDSRAYHGKDYLTSAELDTVASGSSCIYLVRAESLFAEGNLNNTETYSCTVLEAWKGPMAEDEILVVFPAGTAEENGTYIVMVDRINDTSRMYVMSSKNSVFSADDGDVMTLLEGYGD